MEYLLSAIMFAYATYGNGEIGNGDEGLFKTRVPVYIIWAMFGGLLSYGLLGWSQETLCASLYIGVGFPLFRQVFSPTTAMFAGHGRTDALPRVGTVIKYLSKWLFNAEATDVQKSKAAAIRYGILVGGLTGFCKSFLGWGIIGSLIITPLSLLTPVLGILYGLIHYFWGQIAGFDNDMRRLSEMTTGGLIVFPCSVLPVWFYGGGLLF